MLDSLNVLEAIYVIILFVGQNIIWLTKRKAQQKATGTDPEVMADASNSLQRYQFQVMKILRASVVVVIFTQSLSSHLWAKPLEIFNFNWVNHFGFALGTLGLALCVLAQKTMKSSWRVGIDEKTSTKLITHGIFQYIRNPTYTGMFMLVGGVWLIWPTSLVTILAIVFFFFLETQVRCEEDFLEQIHGDKFLKYKKRTKRYLPLIY